MREHGDTASRVPADGLAKTLVPALRAASALSDLSVAGNLRDRGHAAGLAEALATLAPAAALTRLDTSANFLAAAALPPLLAALPAFPALAALDLSPCHGATGAALEPAALAPILAAVAACAHLTRLDLRGAFFADAEPADFEAADLPAGLSTLRALSVARSAGGPWTAVAAAAAPEALDLTVCAGEPRHPADLAGAITSVGPQLTELAVGGCHLRSEALVALVTSLPAGLTALDLSQSRCSPAAVPALGHLTALRSLRVAGCWPGVASHNFTWPVSPAGAVQLAKLTTLTCLDLTSQHLLASAALLATAVLPALPALADLRMPFAILGHPGSRAIAEAVNTRRALTALTALDVRGSELDGAAAAAILLASTSLASLEVLNVSLNQVKTGAGGDAFIDAASNALVAAPRLRELILTTHDLAVSPRAISWLTHCAARAPFIERVAAVGFRVDGGGDAEGYHELRAARNHKLQRVMQFTP
jgi:hypothetical protein